LGTNTPWNRVRFTLGFGTSAANNNRESAVVVDEAYIDFGGESAASLINRYPKNNQPMTYDSSALKQTV
jgi:hypothetical protein